MDQTFFALVELNDGKKCEGKIISVDKVNMKIIMSFVTKYSTKQDQTEVIDKEYFPELVLQKDEIKEIKKMSYENSAHNPINNNILQPLSASFKKRKSFSEGFFDNLNVMTHDEAANENYKYNSRNQETFFSKKSNSLYTPKSKRSKGNYYEYNQNKYYSPQYSNDYNEYLYDYNGNYYRNNYNYKGYNNYFGNKNYYKRYNYSNNSNYTYQEYYYKQ